MARYQRTEADTKAIEEWLAKGNKVTQCEPNARSDYADIAPVWGRKKKKAVEPKEVDSTKK